MWIKKDTSTPVYKATVHDVPLALFGALWQVSARRTHRRAGRDSFYRLRPAAVMNDSCALAQGDGRFRRPSCPCKICFVM